MTTMPNATETHVRMLKLELRKVRADLEDAQGKLRIAQYAGLTAVNCLADKPADAARVAELLRAAE